jgi:hypothetical protein
VTRSAPTVVLTMIVKDEAHVIERCIESVRPLIDAWCIVDTGSTDGTQDLVRSLCADLPGELHEIPWKDFAFNRTCALELARPLGDYSLMIDADVICVIDESMDATDITSALTHDLYDVRFSEGLDYIRPQITSTRLEFSYRGVLHEYLDIPAGTTRGGVLPGLRYMTFRDGARSRNPRKYRDDADLLAAALATASEPELEPRYTFYLAQSYRDAGCVDEAIDAYRRRTWLGGYQDEVYVSYSWLVRLVGNRDGCTSEVVDGALRALDIVPSRAEASCHAATVARASGRMATAYVFARHAAAVPMPEVALFVEPDVYRWRALYELSLAAYYVAAIGEGRDATDRLLADDWLPAAERAAVEANAHFYA